MSRTALWACLYFPQLPIDRQHRTQDVDQPAAIIVQEGSRKRLLACNDAARDCGIHPGIALNSAYAMAPNLLVNEYSESEQQTHLDQLALWALRYSSWVTPRLPDIVLLEVAASLKLYGGLKPLLNTIRKDARELGLTLQIGVAPTPSAASLLAHAGIGMPVHTLNALQRTLADLPVSLMALDDFTERGLQQSGIRTLGQLYSLAPAALTRRFGHACTEQLYRLDGRLPDPCPAFVVPDTFVQSADLPLEAPDTSALTFPLNRLLQALGGYLRSGDLGVRSLTIQLTHQRHPPTEVMLTFLDATADTAHLLKVAVERLAHTPLPEPVMRICLDASELAPIERSGKDLFQKSQAQGSSIQQVLDRLMARLGKDAIYTAVPGDDHRPEKAWVNALLEARQAPEQWPARPLWLLSSPRLCREPLNFITAAERIENGWWDDADVRRDYFIAHNTAGTCFWVYQVRSKPQQTWIHGLFA